LFGNEEKKEEEEMLMKAFQWRAWVGSLALVCLVGSVSGCSHQGAQTRTVHTSRAEVRETAPETKTENGVTRSAQTKTVTKSTETTRMAPTETAAYTETDKKDFLTGCKTSCAGKDTSAEAAKFCIQYCGCSHDKMKSQVPYGDLQAYGNGKKNKSTKLIESIRQQCVHSASSSLSGKKTGKS
jgi:hypothetical protein